MKDLEYFAPKRLEDALTLVSQYKGESTVFAGGQTLLVLMRQGLVNPKYLIDIKNLPSLEYIKWDSREGLRIGSLCTHRAIERSPLVRNKFRVLSDMELLLGSVQVRNWGTIGGSLFQGPAGDAASVFIALNGLLKLASLANERTIAVEELYTDYHQTVLRSDEILTEIRVPNPPTRTGTAYSKFTRRVGSMATVGVAVSVTLSTRNDTCSNARIVLGAVSPIPVRAGKAEKMLVGKVIDNGLLEEAGQAAAEEAKPISDVRASGEYRRELVKVLVKRVAKEALEEARRA